MKVANILHKFRNSSYLLNDLGNFNEIFRNDVTYDDIKSHRKLGFHFSLEHTFFEKPQDRSI